MRTTCTIALSLVLFCLTPALAVSQTYTVTDLGSLTPSAINTLGQVVGSTNGTAAIWTQSQGARNLGLLSGGTFSEASSINDLGVVTGTADGLGTILYTGTDPEVTNQTCPDLTQPFVWTQRAGMKGLGALAPPNSEVFFPEWCSEFQFYGSTVNAFSQVGGYTGLFGTYQWGFNWTKAKGMTVFGGSWPPTFINGINFTGEIVGQNASEPTTLFLGHATSWKNGVATDLGTLGGALDMGYPVGYSSAAIGLNDWGQIVGWSTTEAIVNSFSGWEGSSPIHAILWGINGQMHDLGTLPGDTYSSASKINFFGQIVGLSGSAVVFDSTSQRFEISGRPFVWSAGSEMQDLNALIPASSGWVLNSAADINIWGQIVGEGTLNGQPHGFLLTPTLPNASVPKQPMHIL